MKHRIAGRKLGRSTEHRLALLRNLSTSLFAAGRIRTTLGRAKELRPFAERLVTLAKRETLHARRQVLRHIHDREVVGKLFDSLSARYAQRPGGYTRIIKLGPRRGDNAEMALIELVGTETATPATTEAPAKTEGKAAKPAGKAADAGQDQPKGKVAAKAKPKVKAKSKAPDRGRAAAKAAGRTAKPAAPPKKKKAGVRKAGKSGS
jgi:large subunit ribosomal protein L17